MKFRECINCTYSSCTVFRRCLIVAEQVVKNSDVRPVFPQLEPPADDERDFPPEPSCNERWSIGGMCPCCGAEVERMRFQDDPFAEYEQCMSCDWESDLFYDL